jgi:hypothetical protein
MPGARTRQAVPQSRPGCVPAIPEPARAIVVVAAPHDHPAQRNIATAHSHHLLQARQVLLRRCPRQVADNLTVDLHGDGIGVIGVGGLRNQHRDDVAAGPGLQRSRHTIATKRPDRRVRQPPQDRLDRSARTQKRQPSQPARAPKTRARPSDDPAVPSDPPSPSCSRD